MLRNNLAVPPTVICKDIDMESLESLIVSPLTFSRTWDEMGCETELSIAGIAQLAQLPLPQHASTVCHPWPWGPCTQSKMLKNWITDPSVNVQGLNSWSSPTRRALQFCGDLSWAASSASSSLSRFGQTLKRQLSCERNSSINSCIHLNITYYMYIYISSYTCIMMYHVYITIHWYTNFKAVSVSVMRQLPCSCSVREMNTFSSKSTKPLWLAKTLFWCLELGNLGVSENSVPLNPMVLLIIIPMKNGYFIGNIPNIFRQTHLGNLECCFSMSRHVQVFSACQQQI